MSPTRHLLLLLGAASLAAGCAPPGPGSGDPLGAAARAKLAPEVVEALAAGTPQQLLVVLATPAVDPVAADGHDAVTDARPWLAAKADLAAVAADAALTIDDVWDELPIIPVTAPSLDELAALLDDPRVISASAVQRYGAFDAESFPLIGQPTAAAAGKVGTGTTVAVLDTGVDYTRAPFGCTAPGLPTSCRVAVARDFAVDDSTLDSVGHGTNVAGIVVGVAPGARILALDVFDGATASSTTILAAYNWVLQNRTTYNVAAVNLSLGGGRATAPCTTDPLAVAFQTGRNAGLVTTVASGNDGAIDATAWPACAPAAVSVGAVYDAAVGGLGYANCSDPVTAADRVACFSNSATFLTLLAPGALIDAAGYRMAGTSQAAPHVAGAVAVLRAALPAETANQLVNRLVSGGRGVVDARTGRRTPRLDLPGALGLVVDVTPPVGTMTINAGARYAKNRAVTLSLVATDVGGVTEVCVGDPCTTFVAYAPTIPATLAAGADGSRSLTVRFRDRAGNVSAPVSDAIVLDTTAPVITGSATTSAAKVTLRWSATDATSGVDSYRLVGAPGPTLPAATCTIGSTLASGVSTLTYTHGPLALGATWSYRVCATDAAGNTAAGVGFTVIVR